MNHMDIYEAVRTPPQEALKSIEAGRLKGMTDINPMWRIKALTECFGPCGIGWKPVITRQWTENGSDGTMAAFCNLDLYIKTEKGWSDPIPGTGGSMFVAKERSGLYTSDECHKMAFTDALSVACKLLGFAADVYWEKDRDKYSGRSDHESAKVHDSSSSEPLICKACGNKIMGTSRDGIPVVYPAQVAQKTGGLCKSCYKAMLGEEHAG